MSITFETKCWEKDWMYLLKENRLDKMIDNCDYDFSQKILYINNVNDMQLVESYAEKKVCDGVIDRYIIVDNYAKEALDFFQIKKDDFKGGYYYSIAELVSLYLCETDLLLHFSSDACLVKDNHKWVEQSIKLLSGSDKYFVMNPLWDNKYAEAQSESFDETEDNFIGFGFSDQCYMVRKDDFRKPIYNETNIASQRYPIYGGELFEKRVDSYMRNHNLFRATSKKTTYIHENYKEKKNFFQRIFSRKK